MDKLDFYELAKEKVSEDFAKGLLYFIEEEVNKKYAEKEKHIASKEDIASVKQEIKENIASVKQEIVKLEGKTETSIAKLEATLGNKIYATGLVQFIAILASLITLLKFFDLK